MNRLHIIALTATVFFGGLGAAQTPQTVTETSLRLSDTQGILRAVLVSGDSTTGLSTETLQQSGTWFSSVHPRSSLSEVSSYYQTALTQLGFGGTAESVSEEVTVWAFEKDGRQISVVFNRQGNGVVANISWL